MLKVEADLRGVPTFVKFKLFREILRIEIAELDIMLGMIEFKDKYSTDYRGVHKEIPNFTKV